MPPSKCQEGHVCMWEDSLWEGTRYVFQKAVPGRYGIDDWDGDKEISSVINNSNCTIVLFSQDDPDTSYRWWQIAPMDFYSNLKNLKDGDGYDANDRAQSFEIVC
ncbi:peptidase inhibitor family I36 protein [Allokutzneria multivorans]